jgi:hypothetical protein
MAKKVNSFDQFRKNLGKQIKQQRQAKGHSTYAFAAIIGKPQPRVPDIENGKVKELDTYLRCLDALGGKLEIKWD